MERYHEWQWNIASSPHINSNETSIWSMTLMIVFIFKTLPLSRSSDAVQHPALIDQTTWKLTCESELRIILCTFSPLMTSWSNLILILFILSVFPPTAHKCKVFSKALAIILAKNHLVCAMFQALWVFMLHNSQNTQSLVFYYLHLREIK